MKQSSICSKMMMKTTINQQYQPFSNKTLLLLNKYLEKIRPELINLMTKYHEVKLNANLFTDLKTILIMNVMCLSQQN